MRRFQQAPVCCPDDDESGTHALQFQGGNGHRLLALILAGATLVLNGGLWIVNRMTQMDDDRQKLAIVVEQRMGRIEARLDELVYRLGSPGTPGGRARR